MKKMRIIRKSRRMRKTLRLIRKIRKKINKNKICWKKKREIKKNKTKSPNTTEEPSNEKMIYSHKCLSESKSEFLVIVRKAISFDFSFILI